MSDCTDVKKALVLVESYCRRGEAEKRHQENRWALLDNVQAIRQLGELQENTEKKKHWRSRKTNFSFPIEGSEKFIWIGGGTYCT